MKILAVVLSLLLIFICIQNALYGIGSRYLVVLFWYIPMPTFVLLVLGILIGIPIGRYSIRHF